VTTVTSTEAPAFYRPVVLFLFVAGLTSGALLMFVAEPLVGRMMLPLLGGAPAVWNTCVMFFQGLLLAGYVYAHIGHRLMGVRWHALVHTGLMLVSVLAVGTFLTVESTPNGSPTLWLLRTLTVSIGLPFFLLSSTAPLLQLWFSRTRHRRASDPYFLYAASNVGSLIGLLMYPLAIEPLLPTSSQISYWRAAYVVYVAVAAACTSVLWLAAMVSREPQHTRASPPAAVSWQRRLRWVGLAFAPSSLMLAVTTFISTDVAAVPLLWVVPLALYLITFVVAFSALDGVRWMLLDRLLPVGSLLLVLFLFMRLNGPLWTVLIVHLGVFFLAALVCHRELANDRPEPEHLTQFYLLIAVGGVVGSAFNTLVAPAIFTAVVEYPVALFLVLLLRRAWDAQHQPSIRWQWIGPLLVALAAAGVLLVTFEMDSVPVRFALMGIPAVISLSLGRTRVAFVAALTAILVVSAWQPDELGQTVMSRRTFFGTYRVRLDRTGGYLTLIHGTTVHGMQSLAADKRNEPLSYYHPSGPLGDVFDLPIALHTAIGVVGLGVGSIAAYRRDAQRITFFEIDPAVEAIARTSSSFTYLSTCGDSCRVVIGDARQSLARSGEPFGVLVLDAFSSDAIPVHLLTREALQAYLARLTPNGVVAFHISNRHLDLEPVLFRLAQAFTLTALIRRDQAVDGDTSGRSSSVWVAMARDAGVLSSLQAREWQALRSSDSVALWTDDFSNVVALLRW
jgi:spermidine synthase